MNVFLARFSVKNMRLGLSRTWVLPVVAEERQPDKLQIAAYYSLASSTVMKEEIPSDKNRRLLPQGQGALLTTFPPHLHWVWFWMSWMGMRLAFISTMRCLNRSLIILCGYLHRCIH